ncbi:alpha/beta hydrolase [Dyadobacter tibetensis]|uniref:alpha/beta hydrolase n=1 Tax=Dyadobacter tibetensis TaxID=1211851 RepID=UPI00046FE6EF|nr:alpha/beta hydrolase [Dyadobacter tibetensis]
MFQTLSFVVRANVFLFWIGILFFESGCSKSVSVLPEVNPPTDTTTTGEPTPLKPSLQLTLDTTFASDSDEIFATTARFGSKELYSWEEIKVEEGIYGQAVDYLGRKISLQYKFMAPANDTLSHRPFIMMIHEGAFLFGDKENETNKVRSLAMRGYAVATINYRVGYDGGSQVNPCGGQYKGAAEAIYRAVQDSYTALHYFMDRRQILGIDTSQVFLAGSSAGAITLSALAYTTESDFEKIQPGLFSSLGPLDPWQVGRRIKIRGLLTSLGYGLPVPHQLRRTNARPIIFFQKAEDTVLPNYSGPLFGCKGFPELMGSELLVTELKKYAQSYELNIESGTGHLLNFPDQYIAEKYAVFIKKIWQKDLQQSRYLDYNMIENNKL